VRKAEDTRIHGQLLFFGEQSLAKLAAFPIAHGVHDVVIESLMHTTRWGPTPQHPCVMLVGRSRESGKRRASHGFTGRSSRRLDADERRVT
jgi:hypothetical protein